MKDVDATEPPAVVDHISAISPAVPIADVSAESPGGSAVGNRTDRCGGIAESAHGNYLYLLLPLCISDRKACGGAAGARVCLWAAADRSDRTWWRWCAVAIVVNVKVPDVALPGGVCLEINGTVSQAEPESSPVNVTECAVTMDELSVETDP